MTPPLRILGISGSLRRNSYNSALLRLARDLAPAGAAVEIADIRPIPLYDGDVEAAGMPEPVAALRASIKAADALLFACPEYNYSVSGVLKNAIDWASRPPEQPFAGKPFAVFGGGGGFGTVRGQLHLRQILTALGAHGLPKPELHVANIWTKFDADLTLTDDTVRENLQALMAAFAGFAGRLREG